MVLKPIKTALHSAYRKAEFILYQYHFYSFMVARCCKVYKDLNAGLEEGPVLGAVAFGMKQPLTPGAPL